MPDTSLRHEHLGLLLHRNYGAPPQPPLSRDSVIAAGKSTANAPASAHQPPPPFPYNTPPRQMGRFRTYLQMVRQAIKTLDERDGSSQHAIKKYIIAHESNTFEQHYLRAALKNGVESGDLVMVKRSFKLGIKVRFNHCTPLCSTATRQRSEQGGIERERGPPARISRSSTLAVFHGAARQQHPKHLFRPLHLSRSLHLFRPLHIILTSL